MPEPTVQTPGARRTGADTTVTGLQSIVRSDIGDPDPEFRPTQMGECDLDGFVHSGEVSEPVVGHPDGGVGIGGAHIRPRPAGEPGPDQGPVPGSPRSRIPKIDLVGDVTGQGRAGLVEHRDPLPTRGVEEVIGLDEHGGEGNG